MEKRFNNNEIELIKNMLKGEIAPSAIFTKEIKNIRNRLTHEDNKFFFQYIPKMKINKGIINELEEKYSEEIFQIFINARNYYHFIRNDKKKSTKYYDLALELNIQNNLKEQIDFMEILYCIEHEIHTGKELFNNLKPENQLKIQKKIEQNIKDRIEKIKSLPQLNTKYVKDLREFIKNSEIIYLETKDYSKMLDKIESKKLGSEYFSWTPMRRLMKNGGATIVARDAVDVLIDWLGVSSKKITENALKLTKHANRKKITKDDILFAIKYFK